MPYQDDVISPGESNKYIVMEVLLPRGYGYQCAPVGHRDRNFDGELIGL